MLAHLDSPPPSVLSVLPDASELLGEVVRRAMAKHPDDRYPSAGDLGRAARAAVGHIAVPETERSVAVGDASPRTAPAASAPAGARRRDRARAVRGPRGAARAAGGALQHRGQRRAPVRRCWRASPGSARRGSRPSSRGAPSPGRDRPLRPLGPRGARCPTSRSSPRWRTSSPTARRSSCRARSRAS